jgi:hypothetical protein
VFENKVLRRIFGPKKVKLQEVGASCIMRIFINFNSSPSITTQVKEMCRTCSTNGGKRLHMGNWWGNQNERDH